MKSLDINRQKNNPEHNGASRSSKVLAKSLKSLGSKLKNTTLARAIANIITLGRTSKDYSYYPVSDDGIKNGKAKGLLFTYQKEIEWGTIMADNFYTYFIRGIAINPSGDSYIVADRRTIFKSETTSVLIKIDGYHVLIKKNI